MWMPTLGITQCAQTTHLCLVRLITEVVDENGEEQGEQDEVADDHPEHKVQGCGCTLGLQAP
jgi:hypothetical protein